MACNNPDNSTEASFYFGASVTYYAMMGIVFAQCKDCEITKVLSMAGYIDGFFLLNGIMCGAIERRVMRAYGDNSPPCFNLSFAAGFLTMNALLAVGASFAYLRDGDSYTARRLNVGAAVAGGLFFIIPILRILNYYCGPHGEQREERRPLRGV